MDEVTLAENSTPLRFHSSGQSDAALNKSLIKKKNTLANAYKKKQGSPISMANLGKLISSYEMLEESFRAKCLATEQLRTLHEKEVSDYKAKLEESRLDISRLEGLLDIQEEKNQTRLARKDLSVALTVIARLDRTRLQQADDDNGQQSSDESEIRELKILIDLEAEKQFRGFVLSGTAVQEQLQLEDGDTQSKLSNGAVPDHPNLIQSIESKDIADSELPKLWGEELKTNASLGTETRNDMGRMLQSTSEKKSVQTQTECMEDSARRSNELDSTFPKNLQLHDTKIDSLECENEDLRQNLRKYQTNEQNLRESLGESERVKKQAIIELKTTKQRLEESQHEQGSVLGLLNDANHQRDQAIAGNEELKRKVHSLLRQNYQLQDQLDEKDEKIADLSKGVGPFIAREQELRSRYDAEVTVRRKLYQALMELKGNIRVICRVRPLLDSEKSQGVGITFPYENEVRVHQGITEANTRYYDFELDAVFRPRSTQEDLYSEIYPFIQSVVEGKDVCIFTYGQTGSGKTYTMEGTLEEPGIYPRALNDLFFHINRIDKDNYNATITCSIVEVYNEQIRDLLASENIGKPGSPVAIEGHQGGDVQWTPIYNKEAIRELLQRAQSKRMTATTNSNVRSSRSHMIVEVHVSQENKLHGQKTVSTLNLIDLAGSERVSISGSSGERLREAQAINKSLSALGDVINAIKNKQHHKPFRNSKLTRLLMDSMDGNSKIVMIVNLSPSKSSTGESSASLHFAERVRSTELNSQRTNEARTPKKEGQPSPSTPKVSSRNASPHFKIKIKPHGSPNAELYRI